MAKTTMIPTTITHVKVLFAFERRTSSMKRCSGLLVGRRPEKNGAREVEHPIREALKCKGFWPPRSERVRIAQAVPRAHPGRGIAPRAPRGLLRARESAR